MTHDPQLDMHTEMLDLRSLRGLDDTGPPTVDAAPLLSVVIPTYNEAERLPPTLQRITAYLARQPYAWEVIISDDGSRDGTAAIAFNFAEAWPSIRVLLAPHNQGKGAAVKRGMLAAHGKYVLFSDADLSTPIEDIEKLMPALLGGCDVVIGSRAMPDSAILTRQPLPRQIMGKIFRRVVHRLALGAIHDSQCGFKALRTSASRHIFAQLETVGFAFDVELLLLAEALGYQVEEVGVTWEDRPGTTVSPLRDSWRMLRDIFSLRHGVDRRLNEALQSVPGERTPCLALVTLRQTSGQSQFAAEALTDIGRHAADTIILEQSADSLLLATLALTPREVRQAATELTTASTEMVSAQGQSGVISNEIEVLPLATPITWLRETPALEVSPAVMGGELLTKLHLLQEAREADLRGFEQRHEEWKARRRTLRTLIIANLVGLAWWLVWLYNFGHAANGFLYSLLVIAETFNVTQVLGYWYTIWHEREPQRQRARVPGRVDVFITTYNEPVDLVAETVRAAVAMPYPHRTYVLDDGHRPEIGAMARQQGAEWITRPDNRGAKAGNINHALSVTNGDYFVIFDADHVPHPDFLTRMMPYMDDPRMGFVQAPQYYANRDQTYIAGGAMDQQEIFFGPICAGKDGLGAVFCCGTNMVIRRAAILDVGGFREDSITEDAATSLDLHEHGWKSRYVPERLAEGLAPEDLGAYLSQQRRWARGNLEMLLKMGILRRRMALGLRLQYVWSAMYYLTGLTTTLYLSLPVLFLLFGIQTVSALSGDFIAHFLPYIFTTIFILARSTEGRLRFRAIQLSYGLFPVFIGALVSVLTGRKVGFQVTPKQRQGGSFYHLIIPQIVATVITVAAIIFGFAHYSGARTVTNAAWAAFDLALLYAMIRAAMPQKAVTAGASSEPAGDRIARMTA